MDVLLTHADRGARPAAALMNPLGARVSVQCSQCRQPNDDRARFCVECGTPLRARACPSCGTALPGSARFCPSCGTAAASRSVNPADALLAARDLEGLPEHEASPDDLELLERVHEDRVRKRRLRRSLAICAMAAIVLAATLVWTRRATDERIASSPPTAAETSAAPAAVPLPETARPVIAAPEPARRVTARTRVPDPMRPDATESQPADGGTEAQRLELPPRASAAPTDTPSAAPAPSAPDVRVEVAQKVDGPNIDYTVRLFRPGGGPVTGADVRLRGVTTDGMLVEAPLQPAGPPGVYHALLAFSARGPKGLTLRIARADGVLEVPVAPAPSGSPPGSR